MLDRARLRVYLVRNSVSRGKTMVWLFIGSVAALFTSFGFAPQVLKILRTRSVRDISMMTFIQFSLGAALWAVYGVHRGDPIIIAANLVSLSLVLTGAGLYLRYHRSN
jgi:MtN3 and saliva related transmembrane protein